MYVDCFCNLHLFGNLQIHFYKLICISKSKVKISKAVPLHAMEALGGRGGIAPTHSRPRH
jgi:hypothetical protein